MKMGDQKYALRYQVEFKAVTGIMIRTGGQGEYSDSEVETTSDGHLHISGDVWSSLLRRALLRCKQWSTLAAKWGDYDAKENGVSPLWTEDTFLEPDGYQVVISPGNRIERKYGATDIGPLWSDELACPFAPLIMAGTVFFKTEEEVSYHRNALLDALTVIGTGIVSIGGGWSYGHGRLKAESASWSLLNLTNSCHRSALWSGSFAAWHETAASGEIAMRPLHIAPGMSWQTITVDTRITPDQMLAIHTMIPAIERTIPWKKIPDRTIFTRPVRINGLLEQTPVVTGKAFRQAILSREIERRILSTGGRACLLSDKATLCNKELHDNCNLCRRDLWFGTTESGGLISVGDALMSDWNTESIFRRLECEHSRQTVNLFNFEYATAGNFTFTIIVDHARPECLPDQLCAEIRELLAQMAQIDDKENGNDDKGIGNAPPGWYRLGATSGCTGQITVKRIKEDHYAPQK